MSEDERILRLENAMATLAELAAKQQLLSEEQQRLIADQQRRTARLEESFVVLVELTRGHDESIDELKESVDELKAARAETERKFAELAGAMKGLAEAQAHADRRVDALVDIMRDWRNGRS